METWVGGILWKPPSLADAYSGISTPARQAGSTPPLADGRGDVSRQPALVLDPSLGPSLLPWSTKPKLITLMLWLCVPRGSEPGETETSKHPAGTGG